jgi:CubicO group peptidase (beta-lactamase class C family)
MRQALRGLPLILLVFACGVKMPAPAPSTTPSTSAPQASAAPPPLREEPTPVRLARDAPQHTLSGVSFTAPAGWTITTRGAEVVLDGPEPGIAMAIVEASSDRLDEAMAGAWSSFRPKWGAKVKLAQDRPARGGWASTRNYEYEGADTPTEPVRAFAKTFRQGNTLTMTLVMADSAVWDRRRAQVFLVLDSMRPTGYQPESFRDRRAHPLDAAHVARITQFVAQSLEAADVPGAALALVENGKIVFEGGFGVREVGKPAKVASDTVFMIGSCSKPLTSLLLAKLVDEGKFGWETPVTSVYPDFKLGDATTTAEVHMKHLVCACTGLPREGFESLLEYGRMTAKTKIDYVGQMKPTTKIGESFQYSNILGAVAGFIGGHAAYPAKELGAAYAEAVRTRIFEPLGMKRTTVDPERVEKSVRAAPHAENFEGKTSLVTGDFNRAVTPEAPSGGIWSTAHDMAAYLRMELAEGMLPDGRPYLTKENLLARRAPQIATGENRAYGMGLFLETRHGVKVVDHGGTTFGYQATMYWLPDHGVGGILLMNASSGVELVRPFLRKLMEVLFDGAPEAEEDVKLRVQQRRERLAKDRARCTFPADPAATTKLARRYVHPTLGEIAVTTMPKGMVFDVGEWKSAVASCKQESGGASFRLVDPGAPDFMEFVAAERDGKRALVLRDTQGEQIFLDAE